MHLVATSKGLEVAPRADWPTNLGGLCGKGWTSAELLTHPARLLQPLVRSSRSEPLRPATWDESLDLIASKLRRLQDVHGRDAVGVFGGGGLTNEKAYALGKFARVALRTSQIDYNGRFCMSSAASAGLKAFGLDRGLPFPVEDIAGAEAILLVGANPAETMPPILRHFESQQERGGKLIVVDPRKTATANRATLHLQPTPGTDSALANGLLNIAIVEGMIDDSFISARTSGFDEVRRVAASYWPDRVERVTGIPAEKLYEAARILGRAKTGMVLTARGPEQQARGVNNVLAFINVALALGLAGRRHCGYGCITGQGNGQGGREHGQKADQLPGYRSIDDPEHRRHIAGVWEIDPEELPGPGRSAYEMFDSMGCEGGIKGLLVMGSNPAVSAPRAGHVEERLRALDFLIVADPFLSETAAMADVVLPSTQWAEEDGTMTNLEGRVIRRRQAVAPPGQVRSDRIFRFSRRSQKDLVRPRSSVPIRRRHSTSSAVPARADKRITPGSVTNASTAKAACSGPALRQSILARPECSSTDLPPQMVGRSFTRWSTRDQRKHPMPISLSISPTAGYRPTINRETRRAEWPRSWMRRRRLLLRSIRPPRVTMESRTARP